MNALIEEQGKVQERIDALDLWNLDNKIEVAMDALRLPPADANVTTLSGGEKRRVALCRAPARGTGYAPPRRTDQSLGRRVGGLARALPRELPWDGRRDHPRSLLLGQCGEVDPRARPRPRRAIRGELLRLARPEADPTRRKKRRSPQRVSVHSSANSSGCGWPRARGRPRARRVCRRTRSWPARRSRSA